MMFYLCNFWPPSAWSVCLPTCVICWNVAFVWNSKKIRKCRVRFRTSRTLSVRSFVSHAKSTHDTSIAKYRTSASDVVWPSIIEISPIKRQGFDPWSHSPRVRTLYKIIF